MTQDYPKPITPPSELVQKWGHDANLSGVPHNDEYWAYEQHIATRAAQWGADQELEACCEWLDRNNQWARVDIDELHDARRPKPPSLKEQALIALHAIATGANNARKQNLDFDTIRQALEQLDD